MFDEKFLTKILDSVFEGVYFVDIDRTITYWNRGAERITGYSSEEVIGKHCYDNILKHVNQVGCLLCFTGCPLHESIQDGNTREMDVYLKHKDGYRVPVSIKAIPAYDNDKIIGSVEIFIDTTEKNNIEKEVIKYKKLAMKDQLTKLPNRRCIENFLDLKKNEYKHFNIPFGVAFIDIDHFKNINDTYGHDVGDEVLKMLSRTYLNSARSNDLVGRWGGEEFLMVFSNCDEKSLHLLVEKLRMLVENSLLRINDTDIYVTISIGATMIRNEDSMEDLVNRADDLMYQSKLYGRNRCTIG